MMVIGNDGRLDVRDYWLFFNLSNRIKSQHCLKSVKWYPWWRTIMNRVLFKGQRWENCSCETLPFKNKLILRVYKLIRIKWFLWHFCFKIGSDLLNGKFNEVVGTRHGSIPCSTVSILKKGRALKHHIFFDKHYSPNIRNLKLWHLLRFFAGCNWLFTRHGFYFVAKKWFGKSCLFFVFSLERRQWSRF